MSSAPVFVTADLVEHKLTWQGAMDALRQGHVGGVSQIADTLVAQGEDHLLTRSAHVPGVGFGTKTVTIFPGNTRREPPLPTVHSIVVVSSPETGEINALVDGALVTKIKTVADSLLGASFLARKDAKTLAVLGAGPIAQAAAHGYLDVFPSLERVVCWNRTAAKANALAASLPADRVDTSVYETVADAVAGADIVCSATMTTTPILFGEMIDAGTHVDLIGAYRPDMREADDTLITKGEIFVDSCETTIDDIGELAIPIASGVLSADDIKGDFNDLCATAPPQRDANGVTIFKNGGGAHLDLMTANYIIDVYRGSRTI